MDKYYCNICNKKYSYYQSYWRHNKHFHENENLNNTHVNATTNANANTNANTNVNSNINTNVNATTNANPNNSNLNIINNEEIRKYKCKYCNKGFKNIIHLFIYIIMFK